MVVYVTYDDTVYTTLSSKNELIHQIGRYTFVDSKAAYFLFQNDGDNILFFIFIEIWRNFEQKWWQFRNTKIVSSFQNTGNEIL